MESQYLLSVIVTVHNEEKFIDACLCSILNERSSGLPIEVIVVDDGSTDGSREILLSYQKRFGNFKVIVQPCCQGVSVARNIGVMNATGKYILFVDGDDFLISGNFERFVNYVGSHEEKDIFLYGVIFFDEALQLVRQTERPAEIRGCGAKIFNDWIQSGFYSAIRNKIVSRNYILRYSILFMSGIIYEDVLWTAQLFAYDPAVEYVDMYVYGNRMHHNSTTKTANLQNKIFSLSKIYESMEHFANDNDNEHPLYSKALRAILSGIYFQLLSNIAYLLPMLQKNKREYYIDYLEQRKEIMRCSYKFNRRYVYYPIARLFNVETLIKLRK